MNSEIPNLKTPGLRTLSHIQPLEFHDVVTNIRNCMALTSLQHGKGAMKPRLVSSCFCSSSFFSSTLLGIRDGHDKSPPFCSMMFPLKLTSHLYVLPIYIYVIIYIQHFQFAMFVLAHWGWSQWVRSPNLRPVDQPSVVLKWNAGAGISPSEARRSDLQRRFGWQQLGWTTAKAISAAGDVAVKMGEYQWIGHKIWGVFH